MEDRERTEQDAERELRESTGRVHRRVVELERRCEERERQRANAGEDRTGCHAPSKLRTA